MSQKIESRHLHSCSLRQNSLPVFIITPRQNEITDPLRQDFSKISFPLPGEREGGNYDQYFSSLLNKKNPGPTNRAFEQKEILLNDIDAQNYKYQNMQ